MPYLRPAGRRRGGRGGDPGGGHPPPEPGGPEPGGRPGGGRGAVRAVPALHRGLSGQRVRLCPGGGHRLHLPGEGAVPPRGGHRGHHRAPVPHPLRRPSAGPGDPHLPRGGGVLHLPGRGRGRGPRLLPQRHGGPGRGGAGLRVLPPGGPGDADGRAQHRGQDCLRDLAGGAGARGQRGPHPGHRPAGLCGAGAGRLGPRHRRGGGDRRGGLRGAGRGHRRGAHLRLLPHL